MERDAKIEPKVEAKVEAIEIRLLLEAIHAAYGYDFRNYSPSSIRRRVLAALARSGFSRLSELQHAILRDPAVFGGVLDELMVSVTGMFRDPEFFRVFRSRVVPILRTYPLLKIWHSGCATGEEVYASAIVLSEEGLYDRTQIYATDLSPKALEQAKQGTYSSSHVPDFSDNYLHSAGRASLSDYYTAAYGGIAMKDSLRGNILFFQHDLVADHPFGEMQVIFCRNVLIYFDDELRERVIGKFAQSLCPGGLLCLGATERMPRGTEKVFTEFDGKERIYRHEG